MGVFKRVKEIVAADIHTLLDKCEDPVSMAKQYLRQIEEQIEKTGIALAGQFAAEQEHLLIIEHTSQVIAARMRQTELALDRDEERIAEIALADKLQHQQLLLSYTKNVEMIRKQIGQLKQELVRLKELHRELQGRLRFLVSRANAARVLDQAAAIPAFSTGNALRSFDRLEENVRRLEASASARRLGSSPPYGDLDHLDRNEEIRAELERIKAERKERIVV